MLAIVSVRIQQDTVEDDLYQRAANKAAPPNTIRKEVRYRMQYLTKHAINPDVELRRDPHYIFYNKLCD